MKIKTIAQGHYSRQNISTEQESREAVSQKFEELHISVTPVGDDEYLVRTEQAPKGVLPAEEQVTWPVEDWLSQAGYLMDDPLLGLLRQSGVNPVGESSVRGAAIIGTPLSYPNGGRSLNLVNLGQELYNALFQGSLRQRLGEAQAIAHNRGSVLRLRLGLKDSLLPRLPWEVLHEDTRPIATGKDVVFSRYQTKSAPLALPAQLHQPLKILMVLAAPTDQENLALKQEARHLREELQKRISYRSGQQSITGYSRRSLNGDRPTASPPEIELDILEQPDREKLTRTLEQGQYQVLHYAGHSNKGPSGGELYLVSDRTGLTEVLTGDDLAGLLVNTGIRMAVFNSCRGTHTAASDPTDPTSGRNLAEVLVKRGVPGVLAMAERIPDEVALTLTRLFYYNINQGYPVDLSLSRARQGLISAYGSHQMYWALPVLHLHPEFDGYLTHSRTDAGETPADYYGFSRAKERMLPPPAAHRLENTLSSPGGRMPSSDLDYSDELDGLDDEEIEGVFDDPIYDDIGEGDEEAAAFVSELFRQLAVNEDPSAKEPRLQDASAQSRRWEPPQVKGGSKKVELPKAPARSPTDLQLPAFPSDAGGEEDEADEDDAAFISDLFREISASEPPHPHPSPLPKGEGVRGQGGLKKNVGRESDEPASTSGSAGTGGTSYGTDKQDRQISSGELKAQRVVGRVKTTGDRHRSLSKFGLAVGALGVTVVALLGTGLFGDRVKAPAAPKSELTSVPDIKSIVELLDRVDLKNNRTDVVTTIAIQRFTQGDLLGGQEAVEALLDRNALPQAKAALEIVPKERQDDAAINFLKGRLAWQFVQTGNKDYQVDDARRYWYRAVEKQPKSPLYNNALGFAYYAEGEINRAADVWFRVVTLPEETKATGGQPASPSGQKLVSSTTSLSRNSLMSHDALTAYAGLALVMMKSSPKETPYKDRAVMLSKAIKQMKMVMNKDPLNFHPDSLSKNWMWPQVAITDWRSLLGLKE